MRIGSENSDESELATRSDAFGRFRLERADGRRWPRGADWTAKNRRLPPRSSVEPALELQLELGAPLDATLVRVSTSAGIPVSGAEITLSGPAFRAGNPEIGEQGTLELQASPMTAVSDPDGFLRIGCPPGALAHLDVLALGEPPVSRIFRAPADGEHLEIVLPAGGTLSGCVLASDGTPAAWVPLRLALPGLLPEQETRTDGGGRFLLSNIPPGPYELALAGDPLADSSSLYVAGVMGEGEERDVELRCRPEHTLGGRAERAEVPLQGWIVELQRIRTDLFPEQRSQRTDALGRFAFASYSPGSHYRLRLIDPDTGGVMSVQKVSAGSAEVRLEPRDSIGELAGLRGVLRSDDPEHPVVFAELWCDALGRRWTTLVDPSTSQFSFENLPPLSYRLRAWMRGGGPLDLGSPELKPGEVLRIKPRIEAPGSWRLHFGLPAGVSRERVRVLVSVHSLCAANPGTQRRLELDPDNTVQARLQPGKYEYSVLIDGVLFERRSLTLASGSRTEEFEIQPFVRVTIEVRPPRLLAEREAVVALIESDRSTDLRKIPLARGINRSENRFEVFLPPDARRIRLESGQGLVGEWLASRRPEPSQLISIALVETED
ncbi:MAG: carboxypeptidase regulatory-like domain-containing protein [Planctomycetes bacterium]|nr:carboxypeptidase regulatory-like domain-containing protein [Planctomycetota bacterium]